MNITNTILTRTAEEITANARYGIEYVVTNDLLTRIHATVQSLADENGDSNFLGNIIMENRDIVCNLSTDAEFSKICADFEGFITLVKANVASPFPAKNK